jgi:hypothetical protein
VVASKYQLLKPREAPFLPHLVFTQFIAVNLINVDCNICEVKIALPQGSWQEYQQAPAAVRNCK